MVHWIRISIGAFLALALTGISVACCYRFGLRLAPGFEGQLYAILGSVADCTKALLPLSIAAAFDTKQRVRAVVGIALFSIITAYSLTSEIGLYAMGRDAQRGAIDASKEGYANLKAERERIASRLKEIGATKPAGQIRGELAADKQSRLWELSNACTEPGNSAARVFCQAHERRQGDLAASEEADRLRERDGQLAAKIEGIDLAAVMASADAQSEALGRFTGLGSNTVRDGIALLVAGLIELASGFSLWILTAGIPQKRACVPTGARDEVAPETDASKPEGAPDPVRRFLERCSVPRPGHQVAAADLHKAFAIWAEQESLPIMNPTAFGKRLTAIGLEKSKRGGTIRYADIAIAARC